MREANSNGFSLGSLGANQVDVGNMAWLLFFVRYGALGDSANRRQVTNIVMTH